jgi:single stranded DNA-binding protein
MNIAILIGHIGGDVVLNHTKTSSKAVLNFSLCTNRRFTNSQNQLVEEATWHKIVCWGKLAETVAAYMVSGKQVAVEGRINPTREYAGDGKYAANRAPIVDAAGNAVQIIRYAAGEITASSVKFLGKKGDNSAYVAPVAAPLAAVAPVVAPAAAVVAPVVAVVAPVVAAVPETVATTFVGAGQTIVAPAPDTVVADNTVPTVVVAAPIGV